MSLVTKKYAISKAFCKDFDVNTELSELLAAQLSAENDPGLGLVVNGLQMLQLAAAFTVNHQRKWVALIILLDISFFPLLSCRLHATVRAWMRLIFLACCTRVHSPV